MFLAIASPVYAADLPERLLTVKIDNYVQKQFMVEVASTNAEREKGLMQRKTLQPSRGMLLLFSKPQKITVWMKNTHIPLDIIFIDAKHKILNIVHAAQPMDETPIESKGEAIAVLEINKDIAMQNNFAVGNLVKF